MRPHAYLLYGTMHAKLIVNRVLCVMKCIAKYNDCFLYLMYNMQAHISMRNDFNLECNLGFARIRIHLASTCQVTSGKLIVIVTKKAKNT